MPEFEEFSVLRVLRVSVVSLIGQEFTTETRRARRKLKLGTTALCALGSAPLPFATMPLVAVIPQPNAAVELREVPSPELEEDSALFEVELSEVCGTDVYLQRGLLEGVPYPLIPGHVSVGLEQDSRSPL